MKKRKKPEQTPAEFSNNPFTFLKNIKPSSQPKQRQHPAPSDKVRREDDEELFLRAMAGTNRIEGDAEPPQPGPKQAVRKTAGEEDEQLFRKAMSGTRPLDQGTQETKAAAAREPAEQNDARLFADALQGMGKNLPAPEPESEPEDDMRRSPSGRMKQLKRGTMRISAELDLHGCLRDEALARLRNFVSAAYNRRQKAVLVITGKGINSPEGPVLQGAVAEWLRGQGRGMVAEFGAAPRDKGGSGAYVVFLKNKDA